MPLLKNLKALDMVARTLHSEKAFGTLPFVGLTALIDFLWEDWIEYREGGRSHVLKAVATQEADQHSSGVTRQSLGFAEQQVLPSLATSGLVRLKDERVAFAHDLLGDWARMRVLVGDAPITSSINQQRAQSPRWHKAIRLFGQRILEQAADIEQWRVNVENASDESASSTLIRDLFLESLFLATNAVTLIERAWPVLISTNGVLLRRLLDRFLFVATLPDVRMMATFSDDKEEAMRLAHAVRVPYWPYWAPLLTILRAHHDDVIKHAPYEAARVCAMWLRAMPFEIEPGQTMPWRKEAAELALGIAREIQARNEEGSYWSQGADRAVYEAMLYGARDLPIEVAELCLELAKRRDLSAVIGARVQETRRIRREQQEQSQKKLRKIKGPVMGLPRGRLNSPWPDGPASQVDREFQEACLGSTAFVNLVQSMPDVALEVLLAVCIEEPQHDDYGQSSFREKTGLAYSHSSDPPIYFRGPFLQFLRAAPEQGITFALRLVNFVTRKCIGDVGETLEINGQLKLWLGDNRVFRWHHDWPLTHGAAALQSTLMALERWLYEQIEAGRDVDTAIRRIVSESESVAFAGVLFDVGKKLPDLFTRALRPLFSSWVLWYWDFQVSMLRTNGQTSLLGYWGGQPQQIIKLAQDWYAMPHRRDVLLTLGGAIPRIMMSVPESRPLFDDVRRHWTVALNAGEDPEHLGPLIERINPDNYTLSSEGSIIDFQWPEAMSRKHDEQLRQIGLDHSLMLFPSRCRKVLTTGKPLSDDQLLPLFEWLQGLETNPPKSPVQDEEAIQRLENVLLGGIAVLVVLHLDWLLKDTNRITWCRTQLEAIHANPPPPSRFDSEVAIGDERWDDFAAECGVSLIAANKSDLLARKLVAQGVMGYHYGTIGLTMARAFAMRAELNEDFLRLIMLCARWAALRTLSGISRDLGGDDERGWNTRKNSLAAEFISQELATDLPNFKQLNDETLAEYNALYEKRHPEFQSRTRPKERRSKIGLFRQEREKLYAERLGFDERVLTNALAWLSTGHTHSADERARNLSLIRALLQMTLATIPIVDDPRNQEIGGLPSDFDGWVFAVVARSIPLLGHDEKPESLWQPILSLGPPAHDWIERFFWAWFTNGLRSANSATNFAHIWRSMIVYAVASPRWDRDTYGSYRLDGMVIELLGTDSRWDAMAADSTYAPVLATMVDVFAQVAVQWFAMPRVLRNFLYFLVQPAATQLLRPAVTWVSNAVASYSSYDWRDGIEDGLIEYLDVCWRREQPSILESPELKDAFFKLLTSVVSRGSHAAIALRDRIAGSTAA